MIEIPNWIQGFVLVGIALVMVVVPVKVIWEMTRGSRERSEKIRGLADRLKGSLGNVKFESGFLGPDRVRFTYEERKGVIAQPRADELAIRLEPDVAPAFPAVIRTRGRVEWPFTVLWEAFRVLGRVRTYDPLIDETLLVYAGAGFGSYLRALALDEVAAEGKPTALVESLVILRRMPGVRRFELVMSPSGGFRVHYRLRTEDLLFRPEDLESAVHHAFKLYDLLVLR